MQRECSADSPGRKETRLTLSDHAANSASSIFGVACWSILSVLCMSAQADL